ncbi:phosphoinositide phospholipase C [Trichonephila clavata]|uniref:Phosphoinositide phospholipase C n=1 Tax=Trichonephila clavata TaxID=2740835 RepID=A0A8X6FN76_TRICU|nr:phosphoinositide phospholipase C [Trichonephila clavata]
MSRCHKDVFEKVKVEMCCEAMPLQVIIKGMTMGTVMYKVRSPDRWYRRKYKVDIQNMRLTYAPSSKPFWKGKITTDIISNSSKGLSAVRVVSS